MRAAVVPSVGIGDGLMMLVAAHRLFEYGYKVTLFQDNLSELQEWFPYCKFAKQAPLTNNIESLCAYDLIVFQHSNGALAQILASKKSTLPPVATFYPLYDPRRHPSLSKRDVIFDRQKTMIENIAIAITSLLPKSRVSLDNGIKVPSALTYRKYCRRLVIHPTSMAPERTWSQRKFMALGQTLRKRQYDPMFCMHPKERFEWIRAGVSLKQLPLFSSLSDLAAFVYESEMVIGNDSGVAHLASNLGISTLVVASCMKHMTLWRPGWHENRLVTTPTWVPNIKGLRLRRKKWQTFISPKKVVKEAVKWLC